MISIEDVMKRYPITPLVKASYRKSFGKAIPWHILDDVESEVHIRLVKHGDFTAYESARSWLGKVVRSSIAEWWRTRQATECLSYNAPTSAMPSLTLSRMGSGDHAIEAHEDNNFTEFFGYTPQQNSEDQIALIQMLSGIAKAANSGATKQKSVAATATKLAKMVEDGSVTDVVSGKGGWVIPGVTANEIRRLREWAGKYHKASDWL